MYRCRYRCRYLTYILQTNCTHHNLRGWLNCSIKTMMGVYFMWNQFHTSLAKTNNKYVSCMKIPRLSLCLMSITFKILWCLISNFNNQKINSQFTLRNLYLLNIRNVSKHDWRQQDGRYGQFSIVITYLHMSRCRGLWWPPELITSVKVCGKPI